MDMKTAWLKGHAVFFIVGGPNATSRTSETSETSETSATSLASATKCS